MILSRLKTRYVRSTIFPDLCAYFPTVWATATKLGTVCNVGMSVFLWDQRQRCGLRTLILGQDRSETKKSVLVWRSWTLQRDTRIEVGLGLGGLVLCCETRSYYTRRHNDLEVHSTASYLVVASSAMHTLQNSASQIVGYSTWVRWVVSTNIMQFNEFVYHFACYDCRP